jgi:hypothetical protein
MRRFFSGSRGGQETLTEAPVDELEVVRKEIDVLHDPVTDGDFGVSTNLVKYWANNFGYKLEGWIRRQQRTNPNGGEKMPNQLSDAITHRLNYWLTLPRIGCRVDSAYGLPNESQAGFYEKDQRFINEMFAMLPTGTSLFVAPSQQGGQLSVESKAGEEARAVRWSGQADGMAFEYGKPEYEQFIVGEHGFAISFSENGEPVFEDDTRRMVLGYSDDISSREAAQNPQFLVAAQLPAAYERELQVWWSMDFPDYISKMVWAEPVSS